ncbi:hypothetical protein MNBD_ALPHA12-1279 [hydrothermal vent metagenome]|uniref:ATP-grasp domain-containing protein n=1 Tax=hydrothermal vent metagenome TaxID=652676 RepID=A0A3B0TNQ7_9ZZZZ
MPGSTNNLSRAVAFSSNRPATDRPEMISRVIPHAMNFAYRARRFANIGALVEHLRFTQLRDKYYRQLWSEAAERVGASHGNWRFGFSRITKNGLTIIVRQGEVMLDSHLTLELMGNKSLVYQLMAEMGFRIPHYCSYTMATLKRAEKFLDANPGQIVVKPAAGTGGGRGVTTGITDLAGLKKASRYAARFSPDLVVEQQIAGNSYRLLYLNGKFIDAVRRDQPLVVGDGKSSIRKLVAKQNAHRLHNSPPTALSPLKIDHDASGWLAENALSPSFRPQAGTEVLLKRAVNENSAAQNHNVRKMVHPATILMAASLVDNLGVELAGVDILCRDISKPLGAKNGLISEVNTTPGLHHHYLIANPEMGTRVAETLLEYMFKTGRGTLRLEKPQVAENKKNIVATALSGTGVD